MQKILKKVLIKIYILLLKNLIMLNIGKKLIMKKKNVEKTLKKIKILL